MWSYWVMVLLVFGALCTCEDVNDAKREEDVTFETVVEDAKPAETKSEDITADKLGLSKKDLYKYGFNVKRAEQIQGVKRIVQMSDYTKQHAMVKILVEKLFSVLIKAKQKVIDFGYIPGGEFPEEQENLDALGHVFENVAMFGDLVLRVPDITHKLYDKNQEWKLVMNWGVVLANESGIFDGPNDTLLNLMSQELNIIPRDENYVNPYKEATKKKELKKQYKKEQQLKKEKEEKKKKKKQKKKRGPKLGGGSSEEL